MWKRFDRILTKVETKGFQTANKLHVWTINLILCGLAYGTYTFFRDYNEFFIDARSPNEDDNRLEYLDDDRENFSAPKDNSQRPSGRF